MLWCYLIFECPIEFIGECVRSWGFLCAHRSEVEDGYTDEEGSSVCWISVLLVLMLLVDFWELKSVCG